MKRYAMLLLGFLILQTSEGLFRIGFDGKTVEQYSDAIVIHLKNPEIKPSYTEITDGYELRRDKLGNTPVREVTITVKLKKEEETDND